MSDNKKQKKLRKQKDVSDMKQIKTEIQFAYVDVKAGSEALAKLVQNGVYPDIFLMGEITHAVNKGDGDIIAFGVRVDDAPIKSTKPIEVEIDYAYVGVTTGRYALRKLVESGVQPIICFSGKIICDACEEEGAIPKFEMIVERSMIEII